MQFGIILNTFNNSSSIKRSLNSVRNIKNCLKKNNIKIFVVLIDDHSCDNTFKIVQSYYKSGIIDKVIVNQSNKGISFSRNLGISSCKNCDYITFLDGDDELINSEIFKINYIEDIIVFDFVRTGSDNNKNYTNFFNKNFNISKSFLESYFIDYLQTPNQKSLFTTCWAKFYKVKTINKNLVFFDESMHVCEDTDFVFRFLKYCKKIKFVKENAYCYTLPESNNVTKTATFGFNRGFEQMFSFCKVVNEAENLVRDNPVFKMKNYLKYHCLGSYMILYTIRLCSTIDTMLKFLKVYFFLKKTYQNKDLTQAIKIYKAKKNNESKFLPFLIKQRMYFFATLYALFLGKKRYF